MEASTHWLRHFLATGTQFKKIWDDSPLWLTSNWSYAFWSRTPSELESGFQKVVPHVERVGGCGYVARARVRAGWYQVRADPNRRGIAMWIRVCCFNLDYYRPAFITSSYFVVKLNVILIKTLLTNKEPLHPQWSEGLVLICWLKLVIGYFRIIIKDLRACHL